MQFSCLTFLARASKDCVFSLGLSLSRSECYAIFITQILTLWSGVEYKGPGRILGKSTPYRYADKSLLWTPFKLRPVVHSNIMAESLTVINRLVPMVGRRLGHYLARALSFSGSGRVTGLRLRHSHKLVQSNNKHTCGDTAPSRGPLK